MEAYISSMVEDGCTDEQISEFLQQQNYGLCGLSARSLSFALSIIFTTAVTYLFKS